MLDAVCRPPQLVAALSAELDHLGVGISELLVGLVFNLYLVAENTFRVSLAKQSA